MNYQERQKLAEIVRKLRGTTNIREFAKKIGVSHPTILGWENCENEPTLRSLEKIAQLRGETLTELTNFLSGTEDPSPNTKIITAIRQASKDDLSLYLREISDRVQNI
ncbi:MAG TPA: hypothetical protein DDW51_05575 [Cyanobacteria bacterium UBA11367]|nr:hypothetical protein [Cyanobacteria bacterium UBA11367]HBE56754.1 hypothetical protein [Cyanobacteria bacterium UBA11366]HCA94636.1 hypothetical protein [Cyanobacteria bacterium UBA9226]